MKKMMRAAVGIALALFAVTAMAQVNGVPASVTSNGTPGRGMAPGVPASITSLGPNGWTGPCCVVPTQPLPLIPSAMGFRDPRFDLNGRNGRQHHGNRSVLVPVPVGYPIAYPVPVMPEYVQEPQDTDQEVEQEAQYPPATIFDRRPTRAPQPARVAEPDPVPEKPAVALPAQPERPQEPTTVIFKDGRKIDVLNFAIVGDTLYELSPEHRKIPLVDIDVPATQKANDDRGVDFHIPAHRGS